MTKMRTSIFSSFALRTAYGARSRRLGPDHETIYFSSDRAVPVKFPRTKEQAQQDYERMETWDNSNSNIWVLKIGEK